MEKSTQASVLLILLFILWTTLLFVEANLAASTLGLGFFSALLFNRLMDKSERENT